jgi:hypothetical protein
MGRRTALAVGCATVAIAAGAGTAQGATLTMGSSLNGGFPATAVGASGNVTFAQTVLPGAVTASPTDGTIISWRAPLEGTQFRLIVIRPAGGLYSSAGTSAVHTSAVYGPTPAIPTSLAIKKGDLVGLETTSGDGGDLFGFRPGATGAAGLVWAVPPLSAGPPRAGDPIVADGEIALQATVRYCAVPKLKGKRVKAAKKALAAGGCKLGKVKRPKGDARKAAKFVRKQTAPAGSSISDTAKVGIKLGPKPQKRKK